MSVRLQFGAGPSSETQAERPARLRAVRASAGSGKTYTLTTHYLARVLEKEPIQEILATTFTRKAAGEILERVLRRLAAAVLDPRQAAALEAALQALWREEQAAHLPTPDFPAHLRELTQNLHRVSISTIDSFFNRLASSFRYELELPTQLQLLEPSSPLGTQLRLEAISALLSSEDVVEQITGWLRRRPRRSIISALDSELQQLYDIFRQSTPENWQELAPPAMPGAEQVQRALDVLLDAAERASGIPLKKGLESSVQAVQAEKWDELFSKGPGKAVAAGETTFSKKELEPAVVSAYRTLHQYARAVILGDLDAQTRATAALLTRFDQHYSVLRRQHGVVLYSDLPYVLARRAERLEPAAVTHRLDTPIRHLLLDEFQDTSPEQWRVLKPIAQRVANQNGSLFVVGDRKQAIYGWRGGVAGIFERLKQDLPDLHESGASISYRSSQVVLDSVNHVFARLNLIPDLTRFEGIVRRWTTTYETHTAARELPGHVTLKVGPKDSQESDETDEAGEGSGGANPLEQAVAQEIVALTQTLPGASVGVLVRTNDAVRRMLFLLQRQGIDASGEGGNPIVDDPAVVVVLAAFTLADHPGDTIAAFQLEHSPLKPVLLSLLQSRRTAPLEGASEDSLRLDKGTEGKRVASAVRRLLVEQGYAALISQWTSALARFCTPRSVKRLLQLVELAENFDAQRGLRPSTFVAYVLATTVEEPSPAKVRVMTVHKSKGLEFDVVYLLELHKQLMPLHPLVLVERDSPTDPIRAVYRSASSEVRAMHEGLERAHAQLVEREIEEGLCELYVAMTRARYALHLRVKARKETKKGGLSAVRLSHDAIVRAALGNPDVIETAEGNVELAAFGDPQWWLSLTPSMLASLVPVPPLETPTVGAQGPATGALPGQGGSVASSGWSLHLNPRPNVSRSYRQLTPSGLEHGSTLTIDDLLRRQDDPVFRRGLIFHAWLSQIVWLDALPGKTVLRRLALRQLPGLPKETVDGWIDEFAGLLHRTPLRRRFTRPTLEAGESLEVWRERRFVVRVGTDLLQGSFDRVEVLQRQGVIVEACVLDFKSDRVEDRRLAARLEAYRPQLEAYRAAASVLLHLPVEAVRAEVVWLHAGQITVLDPTGISEGGFVREVPESTDKI